MKMFRVILSGTFVLASLPILSVSHVRPTFADQVFDSYGDILWEEEKIHLDNFAIELQRQSDLIGYIIAYAGRRACSGEAKARASRAKKYVVETRGIQENRVKLIDGGYREKLTVVLQPALPGLPAPISPTLKPSEVQIIRHCKPKASKPRKRGS